MKNFRFIILFFFSIFFWHCKTDTLWKGQEPLVKVSTKTRPIQYQFKKNWDLGNGIYCSNDFDAARLNGIVLTDDTLITVLITAENTPINSSPWYAFKLWADTIKNVQLKITYSEGVNHRYYPKTSHDKITWHTIDSTHYLKDTTSVLKGEPPKFCSVRLTLSTDTLWVAAQEIINSDDVNRWSARLAEKPFVSMHEIGKSFEGRPINMLQIGNPGSKKMGMILSRQHPPEITGWLAMKWFVETLCEESSAAEKFRDEFCVFVVPNVNPDGVDNGHWRHNSGGIDLNRDWEDFNQPETKAIKCFMEHKVASGGRFYFSIDFHSTVEDIYYTIDPKLKGNMPGLVPEMINAAGKEIPGYKPNIRPNELSEPRISSTSFFFYQYGAEAVTYETGDRTTRDFIRKKAELTAKKLMELVMSDRFRQ